MTCSDETGWDSGQWVIYPRSPPSAHLSQLSNSDFHYVKLTASMDYGLRLCYWMYFTLTKSVSILLITNIHAFMFSKVILYFHCCFFTSSWNQAAVSHLKWILMFVSFVDPNETQTLRLHCTILHHYPNASSQHTLHHINKTSQIETCILQTTNSSVNCNTLLNA